MTEGVPRVREIVREAEDRLETGRGTILFVDEIHRFNKAQQDAFLPHVEAGTITLIGATTENPSFEINGALLSRVRVFVLQSARRRRTSRRSSRRALDDAERGLGALGLTVDDDAIDLLAARSRRRRAARAHGARGGRGRTSAPAGASPSQVVREALQLRFARYDKGGRGDYNILSAFHKSLRGSDPQAALYWMARMIEGGAGSDDDLPPRDRDGGGGHRARGSGGAQARRRRARRVPHARAARGLSAAGADGDLPRDGAEVEQQRSVALDAALDAAREHPADAGAAAHPERADAADEGTGLSRGVSVRARRPGGIHPAGVPAGGACGTAFYKPGPFGFEKEIAKRMAWWEELRAARRRERDARGRHRNRQRRSDQCVV